MKKFKYLIFTLVFMLICFSGCAKKESKNIEVDDIMEKFIQTADLDSSKKEDFSSLEVTERYGISPEDIDKGIVYYSEDENKADKIILIKAKNKDAVENIEEALSAEVIGLTSAWENSQSELKKVNEHVLKTRDNYITLIISDNSKDIEKIFDEMV